MYKILIRQNRQEIASRMVKLGCNWQNVAAQLAHDVGMDLPYDVEVYRCGSLIDYWEVNK